MPDPVEPEIVYETREKRAEESVEELKTLLRRYGPAIEKFVKMAEDGQLRRPATNLAGLVDTALRSGKLDGVIGAVETMLRGADEEPAVRAPARRRRRR